MKNAEEGSVICRGGKVVGVVHTHPGGNIDLSEQDKKTAREKNLTHVCVTTKERTKCYRFPKHR